MVRALKYDDLLDTLFTEAHARIAVAQDKITLEDAYILEDVKNSGKEETWQQLLVISNYMASLKDREYSHMLIVTYFAFKTVISSKKVHYLQMKPGSGKTFVALLIAAYLIKHKSTLIPVYVCLNDVLKQQVEDKAKSVELKMKVILPDQINIYLQDLSKKYYFIIDEFHHMLRSILC